jgi:glucosamine-6-phosphate deaminase
MKLHIYETNPEMGQAAADHVASSLLALGKQHDVISVVFATGAAQLETLKVLTARKDLPWDRVIGFHMDEYIGISDQHPASFRRYLRENLVSKVRMREFHYMDGSAKDPEEFAEYYAELLEKNPPQLCLGGIGENGHLAFNDPPVADFHDPLEVKVAELDRDCRQQQVNERWFASLNEVPTHAITLTIPAVMRIPELVFSVPGERKAAIVKRALEEEISTQCPATILRKHPNAHVYLDRDSARLIQ